MSDWYYARNGQQTGPVSLERMQELIRSGMIDPQRDLVWAQHLKDWKLAADVEELAVYHAESSLRGLVQASGAVPAHAGMPTAGLEIEPGSDPIDIGACVSRGFELTKCRFGEILLVGLVYFGIQIGIGILTSFLDHSDEIVRSLSSGDSEILVSMAMVSTGLVNLATQVVSIYLSLGLTRVALNFVDGRAVEVGQLFGEGGKLLRAIGSSILFGLAVTVGILLLIVPGIYIALRYGQYLTAIVDKNLGVFESFAYSSRITLNNKWPLFGLSVVATFIALLGLLACGVGMIFTGPVAWLAWVVAYRWMQAGRVAAMGHVR